MRHTKIVATLGPASSSPAILDALIAAGADGGEPSILYGDLCRRGPACIHRREPAVREVQITRASTRVGGCLTEDGN